MASSDFSRGAEIIRDCVISMCIGFQNERGYQNLGDPEYKAYQRVIDTVVKNYGEPYTKIKL